MKVTTIKITDETKERLDKLKEQKNESYETVIKKILWVLNMCKTNPLLAKKNLEDIENVRLRTKRTEIFEKKLLNKKLSGEKLDEEV